jgi:hypothetical protein
MNKLFLSLPSFGQKSFLFICKVINKNKSRLRLLSAKPG